MSDLCFPAYFQTIAIAICRAVFFWAASIATKMLKLFRRNSSSIILYQQNDPVAI